MALTHCYATVAELQAELGVTNADHLARLERALNAASRQIDAHTGWIQHGFWPDATVVARVYEPHDTRELDIPEGISTADGLIVKVDTDGDGVYETTLTSADYQLEPANALLDYPARPYTEICIRPLSSAYFPMGLENTVQVTAKFGWPDTPDDVNKACLAQAAYLFGSTDSVYGGSPKDVDLVSIAMGLLAGYGKPRVA